MVDDCCVIYVGFDEFESYMVFYWVCLFGFLDFIYFFCFEMLNEFVGFEVLDGGFSVGGIEGCFLCQFWRMSFVVMYGLGVFMVILNVLGFC